MRGKASHVLLPPAPSSPLCSRIFSPLFCSTFRGIHYFCLFSARRTAFSSLLNTHTFSRRIRMFFLIPFFFHSLMYNVYSRQCTGRGKKSTAKKKRKNCVVSIRFSSRLRGMMELRTGGEGDKSDLFIFQAKREEVIYLIWITEICFTNRSVSR